MIDQYAALSISETTQILPELMAPTDATTQHKTDLQFGNKTQPFYSHYTCQRALADTSS